MVTAEKTHEKVSGKCYYEAVVMGRQGEGVKEMSNWQEAHPVRRGFLYDSFRVFYEKDKKDTEFEFHSHVFHKLILFISGSVKYNIEGRVYTVDPWDVLLVRENEIHRPLMEDTKEYERLTIWVHENTLKEMSRNGDYLGQCFEIAKERNTNKIPNVLRADGDMKLLVKRLIAAGDDRDFGSEALRYGFFVALMVMINRVIQMPVEDAAERDPQDPRIPLLLDYINGHLSEDLSVQKLSERFYFSRFYLMHQFKAQTGFTLHQYILRKRLAMANALVRQGQTLTAASQEAGFCEYSSFLRAFQKHYGMSPRNYHREIDGDTTDNHFV